MKIKLNLLIVLIVSTMLLVATYFSYHYQLGILKNEFIAKHKSETEDIARNVSTQFKYVHQLIKSIAEFDSIKNIDRYAKNFTEENRNSLRQLYRYAYLNIALSEIYIVPKNIDPEKIDAKTNKNEEPILMFDDFIAKADEGKEEASKLEAVEIEEYKLLKEQMIYLNSKYQSFNPKHIPVISGKEVITCDNSEFTEELLKKGDNSTRNGIMVTTPIYNNKNELHGAVTAVLRTAVIRKMIPNEKYLIALDGVFAASTNPIEELVDLYKNKKSDLIYSEIVNVEIPDEVGTWKIYSAAKNSEFFFSQDVIRIKNVYKVLVAFIILICCFCLYLFNKSNKQKEKILNLASRVNESVTQMRASATELQSISSSLSSETDEQASSIQETSASIVEINTMISNNSDTTQSVVAKSNENLNRLKEGKDSINFLNNSINEITEGNNDLIKQINTSNEEIENILLIINEIEAKTKVINDIVFQTKLLSFNASVEAARAGDAGKGFAVVAEEVGNLAMMSGGSSVEISGILERSVSKINEIIRNSNESSKRIIEENNKRIQNGLNAVNECEKVFNEIFNNVDHSSKLIKEISEASKEQAFGVTQINTAVAELDNSTHQIAQNASLTAKSSAILANEIVKLEELSRDLHELMKI